MIFFGKLHAIQSDISEIDNLQAAEANAIKYYNLLYIVIYQTRVYYRKLMCFNR